MKRSERESLSDIEDMLCQQVEFLYLVKSRARLRFSKDMALMLNDKIRQSECALLKLKELNQRGEDE